MPTPTMGAVDVQEMATPAVAAYRTLLQGLLAEAAVIKPPSSDRVSSIEPPLSKHDFPNFSERVAAALSEVTKDEVEGDDESKIAVKARRNHIIETVTRDTLNKLVVRRPNLYLSLV